MESRLRETLWEDDVRQESDVWWSGFLLTTVSSRPFKSCLVCSWRSCRNLKETAKQKIRCCYLCVPEDSALPKTAIMWTSTAGVINLCEGTLTTAPPGARSWCCPDSSDAQSRPGPEPAPAPAWSYD